MHIDAWKCDICGNEFHAGEGISLCVAVDREMDAAGSMDDVMENMDLCSKCLRAQYFQLILDMDRSQRKTYLYRTKASAGGFQPSKNL